MLSKLEAGSAHMRQNQSWRAILAIGAAAFLAGCESQRATRVPVFAVEGRILVGGKPAAGAKITLHPSAERGLYPHATVADDGAFRLSTFVSGDGAPAGEYVATVRWPDPQVVAQDPFGEREELPPDLLRGRFASPQTSNLRLTVPEAPVQLQAVDLASSQVQTQRLYTLTVETH